MIFISLFLIFESPVFDILKSTPVGSWQVREELITDHKGKQRLTVIKTSLLGVEERNGEPHYWVEMASQAYKIKRDKRKKDGDLTILKVLIAERAFKGDPANVMHNLQGMGVEVIMQTGDGDPMRMSGAGVMAQSMMAAFGVQVDYDFQKVGQETIETKAGKFSCQKWKGSGEVRTKILFKKWVVTSDVEGFYSDEVPFGTVKSIAKSEVNGDHQTAEAEVISFGKEGATSQITKEPVEMPNPFGQ